ncbi:MAG: GxxExxY protein, partial [Candidatus Hadarchaeum sp.]
RNYGSGHKESLYQRAYAEELDANGILYKQEQPIRIYSPKTGKVVGVYRPDFIIADKIIVELKAMDLVPRKMIDRLFDYLRNSKYELGFFINFGGSRLYIKRIIYTNDRKRWQQSIVSTEIRK